MLKYILQTSVFIILVIQLKAQPGKLQPEDSLIQVPSTYLEKVSSTANQLEQRMNSRGDQALSQMMKQEGKMKRKLLRIDSLKAIELFGDVEEKYKSFEEGLSNKSLGRQYIPSLDTLSTSIKFLNDNPQLVSKIKEAEQKLKEAMGRINGLEDKFQKAEEIKKFLKERKQFLKDQLRRFGFAKELKRLNKQVYYYSQQINEYKEILKDSRKTERKVIELLSKTKLFKEFMRKNSMLASLFRMPGDPGDPLTQSNLAGLQTRTQVNNLIQQQIALGGSNAMAQFRQNIQEAQAKLNELKNKVIKAGGSSNNDELPEGFKPNNQKTKSLWQRLEYSTNLQTQKATNFFPVISDFGLSVGYKLNDKSIVGIGASYKLGWGRGWNHIRLTSEGAGLRSFIDWKLKGSYWVSGGFEMNYKTAFNNLTVLKDLNAWQQSGLIGMSKVVSLNSKVFKKTRVQLLWDFLSYQQAPKGQPVVVRIGYTF